MLLLQLLLQLAAVQSDTAAGRPQRLVQENVIPGVFDKERAAPPQWEPIDGVLNPRHAPPRHRLSTAE